MYLGEDPTIDPDVDAAFAERIARTYANPETRWTMAWAGDTHVLGRLAVAYVHDAADPERGVRNDDLIAHLGLDPTRAKDRRHVNRLSVWSPSQGGAPLFAPCLERVPYTGRDGDLTTLWTRWTATGDMRVRLRWCDTCEARTARHVLRVPEVPEGVLCPICRHTPGDLRTTYPERYLLDWAGPRGSGSGRDRDRTGTQIVATPPAYRRRGGRGYHRGR